MNLRLHPRILAALALFGALVAGMLTALQSRVNGELGVKLESGAVAATVSFCSGFVIVAVITFASERGRKGLRLLTAEVRSGRFPWWGLTGGLCGAFFVFSQGFASPHLGLALFTVGIVSGQVIGGLLMDRVGLGPGGRVNPTLLRLIGTALVIVAVVISVLGELSHVGILWLVFPLLAGAGVSWQSAVNGLVRAAAQSATAATFLNFLVGSLSLLVTSCVFALQNGFPAHWPDNPLLYIGGALGVTFIAINASLVRIAGVLLLSMAGVAGQLLASLLLELGLPLGGGVTVNMLFGVLLALFAVTLAAFPQRRAKD